MTTLQFKQIALAVCRHGTMIWPKNDTTIGRSLGLYGEFAEGENILMARYLKPGDCVVDVGANLGTTALAFAKAVGSTGKVLAFEPQPLIAQCLQATLTINEIFNVRVLTSALAHQPGWTRIALTDVNQSCNFGAVMIGETGIQTPVMRLDDFDLDSLSLIKIDVEGFEWQVLQGAEKQLLKHKPIIYLEAKRIPGTESYLDWLLRNGWNCFWHFAFFFRPDNFLNNKKNIFGGTGDMNVLAIPKGHEPPTDLPQILNPDDNWQLSYSAFFEKNGIPMP